MRRQEGQIIPALVMVMLSLIAVGMLFFQVGRAAIFSTEAQTAADAAALAAARNIQGQLTGQVAGRGPRPRMHRRRAGARGGRAVRSRERRARGQARAQRRRRACVGLTKKTLGDGAKALGKEDTRGEARARARLELQVIPGSGSSGTRGPPEATRRSRTASGTRLKKKICSPPTCGNCASNDLVTLGKLLREHGFAVGENAEMGDNPAPGVHAATGFHYQLPQLGGARRQPRPGRREGASSTPSSTPLQKLGFRTIWQAAGHFDHIHIDVANSRADRRGLRDGRRGRRARGDHARRQADRLGRRACCRSAGSAASARRGPYGGAPDPAVAGAICEVLDRYNAAPKVRLAAFEAAIVESGVHNLNYGDRDSLGVFQQRPSAGWGTAAQILDPVYAATQFITRRDPRRTARRARGSSPRTCRSRRSRIAMTGSRCRRRGCCRGSADEADAGCWRSSWPAAAVLRHRSFRRRRRRSTCRSSVRGTRWPGRRRRRSSSRRFTGRCRPARSGWSTSRASSSARPTALQTSSDASMQRVVWSSWSPAGASGSGEFNVLECQPNCATGHRRRVSATVALSDVKVCDGRGTSGERS